MGGIGVENRDSSPDLSPLPGFAGQGRMTEKVMAEGVIFYNLRRKAEGKTWMAKLRRDMFDWCYSDKIEIFGYQKEGTGLIE